MRTRVAGGLALAAIGLGLAAAILAGVAYSNVLEARAAVPVARVLRLPVDVVPDPTLPGYPALPDAEHLPESFTAQQREDVTLWLEHKEYAAQCMADAGFPGYRYYARWQPNMVRGGQEAWKADFSPEEVQRSMDTLWGVVGPPGVGLDYDWQTAGCDGYGWHMAGIDYPVVY